jgi:hypothetical protein
LAATLIGWLQPRLLGLRRRRPPPLLRTLGAGQPGARAAARTVGGLLSPWAAESVSVRLHRQVLQDTHAHGCD